jgi:D-sedoheptulose 7-phosphate isomerase
MDRIEQAFSDHLQTMNATREKLIPRIEQAASLMIEAYRRDGKVVLLGNGGSATDALHVEGELLGRFKKERKGLPAIALAGGIAALTAIANDYGYDAAFARMTAAQVRPGDVLIAISTSGNSGNIVEAVRAAKEGGASVIGFTGEGGGALAGLSDVLINVPSSDTPRIQEAHITVCHILCDLVEDAIFPD